MDRPHVKYALHPGPMISRGDGQLHHITSGQLARLYNVPLRECVVIDVKAPDYMAKMRRYENLIHLYPQYSREDYVLPRADK
jgi:hypothetical protein